MPLDCEASVSVCVIQPDGTDRGHLCEVLRRTPRLQLAGTADDLVGARALLGRVVPDIALIDLSVHDGEFLSLLRDGTVPAATRVLGSLLTTDEATFFHALDSGVSGWLHVEEPPDRVVQAIEQVIEGGIPISPYLSGFLLRRVRPLVQPRRIPDNGARPKLTPRERETLQFVAKGFSVAEVASLLQISRHTVTTHVRSIYRKLEVHSRSAAIYEAMSLGILQQL
ncbi:MAG: response regulator transcription factor [Myxococcales bacterium]|nr:response regulator transcription factor [Myxococcales bacterium]MDD9968538.1 response regulator transcription factor [Myxococcales bacterium]